jgi:type I restriction enzyme, S subunit
MKDAAFSSGRLLALYDRISDAEDAIPRLRRFVLDLAVRGKLVDQVLTDEPAAELHKTLAEEFKKTQTPTGRGKRSEASGIIAEPPFDVPALWSWVQMGDLGQTNIGLTYSPSNVGPTGVPVLRSNNVQNGKIDLNNLVRVDVEPKTSAMVAEGDMLICARNGSRSLVGKAALIERLAEPMAFGAFMALFRSPINPYLHLFLASPVFRQVIDEVNTTTINQITQANLRSTFVPLPPLAEQHRIVAKVDELMALCDQLEQARAGREAVRDRLTTSSLARLTAPETDAETFQSHAHFALQSLPTLTTRPDQIKTLRQTILNLAIAGKLTFSGGTHQGAAGSSELAIKDPKPYDVHSSWKWYKMDELVHFQGGSQPPKAVFVYEPREGYTRLVQIRDFKSDANLTYVPSEKANRPFKKDDVMIGRYGPPVFQILRGLEGTYNVALMKASPKSDHISNDFIFWLLKESRIHDEVVRESERTAGQTGVRLPLLRSFLVALPPLDEQHRIVAKIDALMALCDQLEASLTTTATTRSKLLNALLYEALTPNAEAIK